MRSIEPQPEPTAYAEWRAASQSDINYGYDLIPADVRAAIKGALVNEQRGLCAYTGIGIDMDHSHIEHLIPQAHCQRGVGDVEYGNMVACYPGPGAPYVPFGAVFKGNWPAPGEQYLFVSPRTPGCEAHFLFNLRGAISVPDIPSPVAKRRSPLSPVLGGEGLGVRGPSLFDRRQYNDEAARVTVERPGLDHRRLEALRREAIAATLHWHGRQNPLLDLPAARRRLASLENAEQAGGPLEPFCFVLKQALRKHIIRLEAIRASGRGGRR
jgi:uncharacterized protein (TIGR02646 family)